MVTHSVCSSILFHVQITLMKYLLGSHLVSWLSAHQVSPHKSPAKMPTNTTQLLKTVNTSICPIHLWFSFDFHDLWIDSNDNLGPAKTPKIQKRIFKISEKQNFYYSFCYLITRWYPTTAFWNSINTVVGRRPSNLVLEAQSSNFFD